MGAGLLGIGHRLGVCCCNARICLACATSTWAELGPGDPVGEGSLTGDACVWATDVQSLVGTGTGRVESPDGGQAQNIITVTSGDACIGVTTTAYTGTDNDVAGIGFYVGAGVFIVDQGDGTAQAIWDGPSGIVLGDIYPNAALGIELHVHVCNGQLGYRVDGQIVAQYDLADFPTVEQIVDLLGGFVALASVTGPDAQLGPVLFDCDDDDFFGPVTDFLLTADGDPLLTADGDPLLVPT